MQNVFWVFNRRQDLVIVQDANLAAVNGHTRTRVATKDDPIALFAPWAARELALVGIDRKSVV